MSRALLFTTRWMCLSCGYLPDENPPGYPCGLCGKGPIAQAQLVAPEDSKDHPEHHTRRRRDGRKGAAHGA